MSTSKKKQELDMEKLVKALDNDNNQNIVDNDLDYKKINQAKNDILQQLQLSRDKLKTMHKQLKAYRYIDSMEEVRYGSYIRWIKLNNPEDIKLTNGGIVVDIKVFKYENDDDEDNNIDEVHLVCRNRMNRLFQIKLNENIVFQKLNDQEQVLLSAMEYLNK
jgi:hypothetical protein